MNEEALKLEPCPWFDWLRFALASIVMAVHLGINTGFFSGGLAVKTFFALSGWLIGGILLRSGKGDMPLFYFNRATRIWIPYGFAILALYGVALLKEGADYYWFKYLFLDATFTHQLFTIFPAAIKEMPMAGSGNQFWSIAVEEQFYLFAPVVMLFLPQGRTLKIWLPIAIVAAYLDWNTASVALGVCAAIAQRNYAFADRRETRVIALVASICSAVAIGYTGSDYIWGPIFAVSLVVFLAIPGRRTTLGKIVGGISFPLYLNAWIGSFAVEFVVNRWLPLPHMLEIAAIMAASIALALGLYWFIDRPVQMYRDRWYSPQLGKILGFVAYALVSLGLIGGPLLNHFGPHR